MNPPWSEIVRLAEVNRGPIRRVLEADEGARRRIAELLDLVSLDQLTAQIEVSPWLDGAIVKARWSAGIEQTCSVSLDSFGSDLEGAFEVRCVLPDSPLAQPSAGEVVIDPDAEDPPDVLESDAIDLGDYVVEHLALELDPFPRAPGVEFEPPPAEAESSPFAVLVNLNRPGEVDR